MESKNLLRNLFDENIADLEYYSKSAIDIQLFNDDCLVKMSDITDKSIDLILCDLPYGTTSCSWDIIIPFDKLWEQYNRIIKDKGAIVLFGTEPFSSYLRLSNIDNYRYDLVWKKQKPCNFFQLKRRFGKCTENICVFYKNQCTYNPQMSKFEGKPVSNNTNKTHKSILSGKNSTLIKPYVDNGYRYPIDILEFNRVKYKEQLHPTQKPVELLEYLIKTYTNENDTVLDNCMGSGSTGIAAINTNRKFIGIEKNEEYFKIAKERISNIL